MSDKPLSSLQSLKGKIGLSTTARVIQPLFFLFKSPSSYAKASKAINGDINGNSAVDTSAKAMMATIPSVSNITTIFSHLLYYLLRLYTKRFR